MHHTDDCILIVILKTLNRNRAYERYILRLDINCGKCERITESPGEKQIMDDTGRGR